MKSLIINSEKEYNEVPQDDVLLEELNGQDNRNTFQNYIPPKDELTVKVKALSDHSNGYKTFSNSSSDFTEEKVQSVFVSLIGMIIHSITDGISFG